MVKRPTHLQFTNEDFSDFQVKKACVQAEKKADKAEKAVNHLIGKKNHHKLRDEKTMAEKRKEKLRFNKAKNREEVKKPSQVKQHSTRSISATISAKTHQAVSRNEDKNAGVQSANSTVQAGESIGYTADHIRYSHKLKAYDKAEKLVKKSDKANVNAIFEKFKKDNPTLSSNPLSRWQQKKAIKKEYAAARAGKGTTKSVSKTAQQSTKSILERTFEFCTSYQKPMVIILIVGFLFMMLAGWFSSCTAMFQGGTQFVLGTSFTSEDEDIIGANDDYKVLEEQLRYEIDTIESRHPNYDEYRYNLSEINHNPYELTAYLTVLFEDYTREKVQGTIQSLFNQQYELKLEETVEIRTRIVYHSDGSTTTEEYEYHILNVTLINHGLGFVIENAGLTEGQMERYRILLETKGNRPYLFEDDIYANSGGEYMDYDIPSEALTNERFANMIKEAEKYLGYPYVWGGSTPSTSFDCSGFVSWVMNHCGNGWNYGRLSAESLRKVCGMIPPSEAKPGDLIFFQGTYETKGASHVGIYVGNGMMIHCGNPISYASIESNYWKQHFYCFGRIPN